MARSSPATSMKKRPIPRSDMPSSKSWISVARRSRTSFALSLSKRPQETLSRQFHFKGPVVGTMLLIEPQSQHRAPRIGERCVFVPVFRPFWELCDHEHRISLLGHDALLL